ncbi:hypothetical protein ACF3MZ_17910 [Paenibacillaceae bacterium WGS1546]|uniref:hypothetical protein n=1 Tax=Cohnella sp. WGS1546 TaxID=3366810 RepID=UPI00372D1924
MKWIKFRLSLGWLVTGCMCGVVIAGCGNSAVPSKQTIPSEVVMTEKALPENFYERTENGLLVEKAVVEDEFAALWSDFGFKAERPEWTEGTNVMLFIGTIESGSCPLTFAGAESDNVEGEMIVHLDIRSDNPCTNDATPRAFVLAVEEEELNGITSVKIQAKGSGNPSVTLP